MPGGAVGPVPAFRVGQPVRVRSVDPPHHTRVPAYVRGHRGLVRAVQPACELADDAARRRSPVRRLPVYSVGFAPADLWGGDPPPGGDEVLCDLWECYLDAVGPGGVPDRKE